jgi:putative redox protein
MTSKVVYEGQLRTQAEHLKSGKTFITDAPVDNQGKGEAFSPTDIVSTALASCAVTIMGIAANNHGINIDGTTAEITKHMGSEPRRISGVDVTFTFPKKEYSKKEKAILENAALTCPVAKSLHPDLVQNLQFVWHD